MPQDFLENGNLYPGIHQYNIEEFEQQFVRDFTGSTQRPIIYENFKYWLGQLLQIKVPRYIWLDGSFLTRKLDPNDIDLVVFYGPEDIESEEEAEKILYIISNLSREFRCDAYFCLTFKHWDEAEQQRVDPNQATRETYWMGQFAFDRSREPKGMVEIMKDELLSKMMIGGIAS
ncbi:DUF6932 family protein [Paenibacillus sp. CN-4]|uniref:DUF6932 family protein n=1 Tax=Paenibacillus nanchangensis TaxID=3348343 RepID=UPI0039797CA2